MLSDMSTLLSESTQPPLASGVMLKKNCYEIHETLGQGSFGITYRAWDSVLQADVAIKEYLPSGGSAFRNRNGNVQQLSSDRDFKRGLEDIFREARILTQNTLVWREMVVPTGVETHLAERKNGSLLGKLRHLFQSSARRPSQPPLEVESEPATEAVIASATGSLATEPLSLPQGEEETKPTGGTKYLSEDPAAPPSLAEGDKSIPGEEISAVSALVDATEDSSLPKDGKPPLKVEKADPPAHNELSKPQSLQETESPVSPWEERPHRMRMNCPRLPTSSSPRQHRNPVR